MVSILRYHNQKIHLLTLEEINHGKEKNKAKEQERQ